MNSTAAEVFDKVVRNYAQNLQLFVAFNSITGKHIRIKAKIKEITDFGKIFRPYYLLVIAEV